MRFKYAILDGLRNWANTMIGRHKIPLATLLLAAVLTVLGSCTFSQFVPSLQNMSPPFDPQSADNQGSVDAMSVSPRDRECLIRAMYFESIRSSEEGMLAVGSVVMNRVESTKFPGSICAVVGQPRQFAPGILVRPMNEAKPTALAGSVANRIIAGARHPGVKSAKFFHQAGLRFPYNNMYYVLKAGGNEFYIKS